MKRQIIIFRKESISSLNDMKSDIGEKMNDSDVSYIKNVKILTNASFDWNLDENTMTITRTWNDEDYADYIANYRNHKTYIGQALKSDGYKLTESVQNI